MISEFGRNNFNSPRLCVHLILWDVGCMSFGRKLSQTTLPLSALQVLIMSVVWLNGSRDTILLNDFVCVWTWGIFVVYCLFPTLTIIVTLSLLELNSSLISLSSINFVIFSLFYYPLCNTWVVIFYIEMKTTK